ncbi:phage tail protein, partial [Escherichia coli]
MKTGDNASCRYLCIFINVGLGEGSPAIGVPFFWPSAAMPDTVI